MRTLSHPLLCLRRGPDARAASGTPPFFSVVNAVLLRRWWSAPTAPSDLEQVDGIDKLVSTAR